MHMAWIYNKGTKLMTECRNKDVIKVCKADTTNYVVAETKEMVETVLKALEVTEEKKEEKVPLSKMKVDDLRALANELGIEDTDGLTADELRKVIKTAQGK